MNHISGMHCTRQCRLFRLHAGRRDRAYQRWTVDIFARSNLFRLNLNTNTLGCSWLDLNSNRPHSYIDGPLGCFSVHSALEFCKGKKNKSYLVQTVQLDWLGFWLVDFAFLPWWLWESHFVCTVCLFLKTTLPLSTGVRDRKITWIRLRKAMRLDVNITIEGLLREA